MEISPATTEKAPCGKLGTAKEYLLRRHKHRQFISCLSGFYSCEWRSYQQKTVQEGQCACSVKEFSFFLLLVATFYLWFIILYFWSKSKNDYNSFDWFTYGKLGYWFLWGILILVAVSCSFSYLLLLMILTACLISERQQLKLHWTHKLATLFLLTCSFAVLIVTKSLWSNQWRTFSLSFQVTGPFLHVIAMFVMILLAWPVALNFFRIDSKVLQAMILLVYLGSLFFLLIIPVGLHSACIMEKETLGPKPGLIGHRGAPMLAPENTEMSFKKAALHGAYGLETDVTISFDGIPFIMHDKTLKRTTNVESLFPGSMKKNAAFFLWKHLKKLNAGNWFFENKPFFQRPTISPEDEKLARNQSVFKFRDFLKLARKENKYIIFNLYRPPRKHPYYVKWINRTLEVILGELGDKQHLVLWLEDVHRGFVMQMAPGFQQTVETAFPVALLWKHNIMKLNLDYRDMPQVDIRKYLENNITTNVWVVNEPWLFSLAWCSGVHSVTTDSIHTLSNLHQPSFLMTPKEYRLMWMVTDMLAVLFISLIFSFHRWREKHIRKPSEQNLTEC